MFFYAMIPTVKCRRRLSVAEAEIPAALAKDPTTKRLADRLLDRDMTIELSQAAKEKLRGYLPAGSRDVVIEGGGHMVIETHAAEVGALTLEFISENP